MPRAFVDGIPDPAPEAIELPEEEVRKFRNVLRLKTGDEVAILPGDGRLLRCRLEGHSVGPLETLHLETEPRLRVTLALGWSRPETMETAIRMATEMGVAAFVLFPAERTVVRWTPDKLASRLKRWNAIAREAAEVCYRTRLPQITTMGSLAEVLQAHPEAVVLSEGEVVLTPLEVSGEAVTLVIGPEGGWAPREVQAIGDRAVTLGPLVLRVDTAVAAAVGAVLIGRR